MGNPDDKNVKVITDNEIGFTMFYFVNSNQSCVHFQRNLYENRIVCTVRDSPHDMIHDIKMWELLHKRFRYRNIWRISNNIYSFYGRECSIKHNKTKNKVKQLHKSTHLVCLLKMAFVEISVIFFTTSIEIVFNVDATH